MFEMVSAGLTDTGLARKNNEDSFLIDHPLLIVADGMGGAAAGEIASSIATEVISSSMKNVKYTTDAEITEKLKQAILSADSEIKSRTRENPEFKGMGTTVVATLFLGDRFLIGYVGDSRAYLVTLNATESGSSPEQAHEFDSTAATAVLQAVSDGPRQSEKNEENIRRITDDHSVVMDLVKSGVITEDEIRTHPLRNRITRCVGNVTGGGPDFVWHDIKGNETLIMCSDGLWEMVYDELILAIVKSSSSLDEVCKRLINAANEKGGADNITVVTATFKKK